MTPSLPIRTAVSRRSFLRASGALLALPCLEQFSVAREAAAPHRLIAICTDLGMIPDYFFPSGPGLASPYLDLLKAHHARLTVCSGLAHPECVGGHQTDKCFLTGAIHPRKPGFKNTVSVDQFAAAQLGPVTRYPALALRVGPGDGSLSCTADGVRVPAMDKPSEVYRRLFIQGTPEEVRRQVTRLRDGMSLMDSFAERIQTLEKNVGARDKERLDQFFTSFREMEQRLDANAAWEQKPKPKASAGMPKDVTTPEAVVLRTRLMYDLARLALETDSTRLVTILVTQQFNPKVDLPGVELPHHALTHQASLKESREQLATVERAQLGELNSLLNGLAGAKESGVPLLQRTTVLYGSNLGNAATHSNANLPVLLAGGEFKHVGHLRFDDKQSQTPLSNLYLTLLHRLGVKADRFSTSTGALKGLQAS